MVADEQHLWESSIIAYQACCLYPSLFSVSWKHRHLCYLQHFPVPVHNMRDVKLMTADYKLQMVDCSSG